jgi:hypothetical protein
MLSQSPGVYIILGAVISSTLLIINNLWMTSINNKLQLEREKQQRIWEEESNQKKWYREKIYDSYKTAIQLLTKIIQEGSKLQTNMQTPDIYINLNNLHLELSCELIIITAGHPNKDCKEFKNKVTEIVDEATQKEPLRARNILIEMMENDSRIKNIG